MNDIKAILRAADELIGTGGRTMLSRILKGSKDKKVRNALQEVINGLMEKADLFYTLVHITKLFHDLPDHVTGSFNINPRFLRH